MAREKWTIKGLLDVTAGYLGQKTIDSPRLTAEVLLARQLNMSRMDLYLNFDRPLHPDEVSGFRQLVRRRVAREPLQYITGTLEFWSLEFSVDPRVLIPRPESELIVEQALRIGPGSSGVDDGSPKILDLGTGSGVLAVALAKELPSACIWATDISPGALEVAQINARNHSVGERIRFAEGDLWEAVEGMERGFDLIVSNPPYVATEEFDALPPEVRDHEPRAALDGHADGMHYIERIISGASDFLKPMGWLIVEMDPRQTEPALQLMENRGYGQRSRLKDYSGNFRVVLGQRQKS